MKLLIIFLFTFFLFNSCKTEEPVDPLRQKSTLNLLKDNITKAVEVKSKTGRIWMDRNLGASQIATSSTDEKAYGDLYQWGRGADGHEKRSSATSNNLASSDSPTNSNFILVSLSPYDWRIPQNSNLWQIVNGSENVCPQGFRLPTAFEWKSEISTWSSNDEKGAFLSPLKLPVGGYRKLTCTFFEVGVSGNYWSNTPNTDMGSSYILYFESSNGGYADVDHYARAYGFSIRCIKD